MEISNIEIAACALCTEGAVRAAISAGRLNRERLDSVLAFVLAGRLKEMGIGYMDDLWKIRLGSEVPQSVEQILDREYSQDDGE